MDLDHCMCVSMWSLIIWIKFDGYEFYSVKIVKKIGKIKKNKLLLEKLLETGIFF